MEWYRKIVMVVLGAVVLLIGQVERVPLRMPSLSWAGEVGVQPGEVFRDRLKSGGKGPEMVIVPAGSFLMGDHEGRYDIDELPVHNVSIQRPFGMGRYEVTFDEYDKYAKATEQKPPDDVRWSRGRRPVSKITWQEATDYAKWLSEQTGERYRLPTEAEWEYAARAGPRVVTGGVMI
jgi:formylglycine-generating enzyme required for sulfatase activity